MAGARKSRFSKDRRQNSKRYGSRPVNVHPPRPVLHIVCDDAKTAPLYFLHLKRRYASTVTVIIHKASRDGASPADILQQAQDVAKGALGTRDEDENDQTVIWGLVDTENNLAQKNQAFEAQKAGPGNRIEIAISVPCFELWTLLHLECTGRGFRDCSDVIRSVEKQWRDKFGEDFKKTKADYRKIIDQRFEAAKCAKRHREADDPSWTEVYLVIDSIETLAGSGPASSDS